VVDLAENPDLIEDLVGAFGVSKLGALDSNFSAIMQNAFVDFSIPSGAEEAVSGEIVCCSLYLFAGEELCSSASAIGV
jgi:hypothetical protein